MRRSVREALVGFSLLAAIASGLGLTFWLRGISLSSRNWRVQASFENAGGLAERSPVAFRGVVVGSVVERLYREIRALRIYEGTSEIQHVIIGRALMKGG